MVRIQNRGAVERGPFVAKYTAEAVNGAALTRPGKRKDTPADVTLKRFPGMITFAAYGYEGDTINVDERDLESGPLARALKNSKDTLVRLKETAQ